jgi:hypothetical protein
MILQVLTAASGARRRGDEVAAEDDVLNHPLVVVLAKHPLELPAIARGRLALKSRDSAGSRRWHRRGCTTVTKMSSRYPSASRISWGQTRL